MMVPRLILASKGLDWMVRMPPGARTSPATARNREPILAVLRRWLPTEGLVLEIAAGAGEHAAYFARAFPGLAWQATDPDSDALTSIGIWRAKSEAANLRPARRLDAATAPWPIEAADAIVCINMVHISPWAATEGLMAGAARVLPAGGVLYLYGPYLEDGKTTAPSNLAFDSGLKARDPAWGVRRREDVEAQAEKNGLYAAARIEMPANNLSLVFKKA